MPSHKDFMDKFTQSLPVFLQDKSKEIYEDITNEMMLSLRKDGLEFRGYFSMKVSEGKTRNIIKFKDLSKI